MAISVTATYGNRLSWSSTFGPAGECVLLMERIIVEGTDRFSVSTAISLGTLSMSLLASKEQSDEAVVAIWGAIVPPSLAGTSYSTTRTGGTHPLTPRFDVAILSGVSSDMLFAKNEYRTNVGSSTGYSHYIAVKNGGIVIDYILALGGGETPNAGQGYLISSSYTASKKTSNSGTTQIGWTWSASRAVYACVSLRPKDDGGGIMGIL